MQIQKRKIIATLLTTAAASLGLVSATYAQSAYPTKAIRLIVPFTPGGVTDTSARLIADQMTKDRKSVV